MIDEIKRRLDVVRLKAAQRALDDARDKAEAFCPSDSWLSPQRAERANAAWQKMREEMDNIGVIFAQERQGWPDN